MKISLSDAAKVLQARGLGNLDGWVSSFCVDSRLVRGGELFFALRTASRDGRAFVGDAFRAGALAAVISGRGEKESDLMRDLVPAVVPAAGNALLEVDDVLSALRRLGAWVRDTVDPLVVGVTGSTGKTTTKDFIAAVAGCAFRTNATKASYNNEIGVPLTLLSTGKDAQVLVVEMGSRGLGQLAALAIYVRPNVCVVTNIGISHLETFESLEQIALEKGALVQALPEGGAAVLNIDDNAVMGMSRRTTADVITYGLSPRATVYGDGIVFDRLQRPSFRVHCGAQRAHVDLRLSGAHHVHNALAALATGHALNIPVELGARVLGRIRAASLRMEVNEIAGVVIVNDTYNANPVSMAAALQCAAGIQASGRVWAVLGGMAELGEASGQEHIRLGSLAASRAGKIVVVAGRHADDIVAGALEAGFSDADLFVCEPKAALEALEGVQPGDVVLIKGSRAAGLDGLAAEIETRIVARLDPGSSSSRRAAVGVTGGDLTSS